MIRMKRLFSVLAVLPFFAACSEEVEEIFPQYPNMLKNGSFEDLNLSVEFWDSSDEGEVVVTESDFYEGQRAMAILPSSCMEITYADSLPVERDATYELSFATKLTPLTDQCLTDLFIYMEQDNEVVLEVNVSASEGEGWKKRTTYLRAESSSPVYLYLFTGNATVLLDDVQFKRMQSF